MLPRGENIPCWMYLPVLKFNYVKFGYRVSNCICCCYGKHFKSMKIVVVLYSEVLSHYFSVADSSLNLLKTELDV